MGVFKILFLLSIPLLAEFIIDKVVRSTLTISIYVLQYRVLSEHVETTLSSLKHHLKFSNLKYPAVF